VPPTGSASCSKGTTDRASGPPSTRASRSSIRRAGTIGRRRPCGCTPALRDRSDGARPWRPCRASRPSRPRHRTHERPLDRPGTTRPRRVACRRPPRRKCAVSQAALLGDQQLAAQLSAAPPNDVAPSSLGRRPFVPQAAAQVRKTKHRRGQTSATTVTTSAMRHLPAPPVHNAIEAMQASQHRLGRRRKREVPSLQRHPSIGTRGRCLSAPTGQALRTSTANLRCRRRSSGAASNPDLLVTRAKGAHRLTMRSVSDLDVGADFENLAGGEVEEPRCAVGAAVQQAVEPLQR
jgi:hypothetical protein